MTLSGRLRLLVDQLQAWLIPLVFQRVAIVYYFGIRRKYPLVPADKVLSKKIKIE
jgi:hypothetical protein